MVAAVSAQEVLSCVVCGRLSPSALLLDCLHSCCEACAVGAARDSDASAVACPKCREVSSFSAYGPNRVAALLAPAAAAGARSPVPPTAGSCRTDELANASSTAVGNETIDDGGGHSGVNGDSQPRPRSSEAGGCRSDSIAAVGLPHLGSGEGGDCLGGSHRINDGESDGHDDRVGGRGRVEPSSRVDTGNATMANSAAAVAVSDTDRSTLAVIDASLQRRRKQQQQHISLSPAVAEQANYRRRHQEQQQPSPGAPLCALHGEKCNLLCMNCRTLMCSTCIRPCLDSKHEVEHRDGKRASEFVRGLAEGLTRWLGELEERSRDCGDNRRRRRETSEKAHGKGDCDGGDDEENDEKNDALRGSHGDHDNSGHRKPLDELQAARLAAAEVLLHNKRRALAAIERAYGAASQAVSRLAERLAAEAGATAAASSSLGDRARQAVAYGRCVLECGDLASLLQQYELLVSRAQLLLDEYGVHAAPLQSDSRAASAVAGAESIVVESALPDNLDELCQMWIGVPRLVALAGDPAAALPQSAASAAAAAPSNSADRPAALPRIEPAKSVSPRCDGQSSHLNQPLPLLPPPAPTSPAGDGGAGLGANVGGGAAAKSSSIGLRPLGSSLSMPVKCCDVAITAAGHLLLAAKEQGVKEYDLRGREMSCWLPRPPAGGGGGRADSACTIDVLHDGRLAVGLSRSRCVVLLRRCSRAAAAAAASVSSSLLSASAAAAATAAETPPLAANGDLRCAGAGASSGVDAMSAALATTTMGGGGDTWIEDRVVARLQSEPRRTSAFADVLAIVEGVASSSLVLVCLPRAHEMLRRELGYCIECVAVAGQTVVTSSYDKLESPPPLPAAGADGGGGGDRRKSHVIECYSFSGERLWRRPTSRLVRDLCPTPSGSVLYLALCESRAVAAIRSDDGAELADVLSSDSHGIQKPLRLSIGRGHRALLAVLNSDCKTVTVYTAADVKR